MRPFHRYIACGLLAASAFGAQAKQPGTPSASLGSCVDLAADHEAFRFGTQYLLVQDGDKHYRLSFNGSCDALQQAAKVDIATSGQSNRLCPQATRVVARTYSCAVRSVDEIDAEKYARYRRMSR